MLAQFCTACVLGSTLAHVVFKIREHRVARKPCPEPGISPGCLALQSRSAHTFVVRKVTLRLRSTILFRGDEGGQRATATDDLYIQEEPGNTYLASLSSLLSHSTVLHPSRPAIRVRSMETSRSVSSDLQSPRCLPACLCLAVRKKKGDNQKSIARSQCPPPFAGGLMGDRGINHGIGDVV